MPPPAGEAGQSSAAMEPAAKRPLSVRPSILDPQW
jgi:hypothetical protein